MGVLKLEYDLGYTHIVQANKKGMKLIGAYNLININKKDYINKKDVYYTPNTFNSPKSRVRENLWQLHRFYIDIDHKPNTREIDKFEVVAEIEKLVEAKKIPQPTEYVHSGRGIHIYWDIANCHIMLLDLWDKIESNLYNQLKEIENVIDNIKIDSKVKDPTRLLRLPGTINSKSNSKCYSMLRREKNIYNIFDLKKAYIKPKKAYKKRESNISYLPTKNLYTLNKSRIEDFKTIVELRNYDVEGYRNSLIMYYSYHYRLIYDVTVNELIEEVKTFNNSFKKPYNARQLVSVCRSINKTVKHFREDNTKGYKFTNKYIIDSLNLTEEEQRKLKTIISTEEKYRRKNTKRNAARRNEEGLTPKQAELQELKVKVLELKASKVKNKDIANKLGISIKTLERYITQFKKEGLL